MIINRIINNTHILAHVFNIITIISRKTLQSSTYSFLKSLILGIPIFSLFINQVDQIGCSLHRNLFGGHIVPTILFPSPNPACTQLNEGMLKAFTIGNDTISNLSNKMLSSPAHFLNFPSLQNKEAPLIYRKGKGLLSAPSFYPVICYGRHQIIKLNHFSHFFIFILHREC